MLTMFAIYAMIGAVPGGILGYWLSTHIHSVASAASRATTLPAGDVAALNAKIDGLGTALQTAMSAVAKPVISILPQPVAAPVAVVPQPASVAAPAPAPAPAVAPAAPAAPASAPAA